MITVNEEKIKAALECCLSLGNHCEYCPYNIKSVDCRYNLIRDVKGLLDFKSAEAEYWKRHTLKLRCVSNMAEVERWRQEQGKES